MTQVIILSQSVLTVVAYLLAVVITTINAASLTTNIDGEACQGEVWILNCTGQRPTLRWTLETEGGSQVQVTYTTSDMQGKTIYKEPYNFTLLSTTHNRFESSVSTVLTAALNNTMAKCGDSSETEPVTIRLAAPPSSPQVLMNRVLESDTNFSRVEVTWKPQGGHLKVDFYHYQVVVDLEGANYSHTLYNATTANTTVVLSIFYNGNATFSLSAIDHCGVESTPVTIILFMNNIGMVEPLDSVILRPSRTDTIAPSTSIVVLYMSSTTKNDFTNSTLVPSERKPQVLLVSVCILSVAFIVFLVLVILCLAMVLKHIAQSKKLSATCSPDSDSANVYAELEPNFPHNIIEAREYLYNGDNESEDHAEQLEDVPA